MYRAIPKRLWERPLDFNLHATDEGELRAPFSRHVLQIEPTDSKGVTFPQFSELPAELQLRVFRFCDNPTLFQLMHTSSCVRSEAEKLFFSDPDTWYCVDANWILRGCHPGDTRHDMEFLPLVKQLEVQFSRMDEDYWLENYHCTSGSMPEYSYELEEEQDVVTERLEERYREFWQRLHARFPQVARVILCESYLRIASDLPPDVFKRVGQLCIPGIEVSFSFLKAKKRRDFRAERSVWQQTKDNEDASAVREWKEIPTQLYPRVILPNKALRGPIGAYEYSRYRRYQHYCHEGTTFVMLTAAVERHHFSGRHEPFQCPAPDCEARFDEPGEFTAHVIEQWEHRDHVDAPAPFEALFAQNDEKLKVLKRDASKAFASFREQWSVLGSEKRDSTEQAALHQIEHDPLYAQGKPAHESYVLNLALDALDGII